MVSTNLSRSITQPVAGLTILTLIAVACPFPTRAQELSVKGVAPALSTAQPVQVELSKPLPPVDYALGGGDRIHITVLDIPEYSGDYQIPPGGRVYVPLIGSVSFQGLTQAQAADTLSSKYARFLKRPLVTVSLISPRPINIVVAGEVNRPGSFTVGLQGGAGNDPGVQYPTVIGQLPWLMEYRWRGILVKYSYAVAKEPGQSNPPLLI